MLWLSSRAALTSLPNASPLSNAAGPGLRQLAGDLERVGPARVSAALDRELVRRATAFLAGIEAYRHHPYRRPASRRPVLWQSGTTRLLDYGRGGHGPGVLVIPSLINRYYVLDLLPQHSFISHLAARGLRPLVIDWGAPGEIEAAFTLDDYIDGRLNAVAEAAGAAVGGRLAIAGYCMGGLLALALALRRPDLTACLTLLATPWDFHAGRREQARLFAPSIAAVPGATVPVEVLQALFWSLDPLLAERKFIRLARLERASAAARDFVALEDWINDGVPLARRVALDCARSWYADNAPARGCWRVAGQFVTPDRFRQPALVVVPRRDRIVSPASAEALAVALPAATVLRPALGHIGMMAAADARRAVWQPIAEWLLAQFGAVR